MGEVDSKTLLRGKSYNKFIIGGIVIVVAIGWLIFSSIGGSSSYYLTVAELRAEGPSERVRRVSGTIVGESIDWNPRELVLKFEIEDTSGQLPVIYHGPRPDMFRDGAQAVIEGKYGMDGVFRAGNLLLKCPSKYEEAATATAQSPATSLPADPTPTLPPISPQEGFTAPDFSLPDLQGNVITLSQFRGRPVLVNFWTTWCPYCVEEMNALEKTYRRYVDQGLVILAVNVQEKAETVAPFAHDQDLTFPILLDSDASTARTYFTIAIPTSFFIDWRGVVRVIHLGPLTEEAIDTYLTDLLNGG